MKSDNCCRLCGRALLREVMTIDNAPRNVQRLLRATELAADRAVHLVVCSCAACGFVQIRPSLEDEYYDDYMMVATHSVQMQEFQATQAREFVEGLGLVGKRVAEIGCGDGSYLDHLKAAGAAVSGVEPSRRTREIALRRGHMVEGGYVTSGRRLEGGPFDGFVTRQVLEHVPDIHDFLTGIHENLAPGGVGLVEVPSLEKAIEDGRFYDFFADHVNYFSWKTLRMALEMNGFDVLSLTQSMFDEYDVAVVRRADTAQLAGIQRAVGSLGTELKAFIDSYRAQGKKVAVWGAGGKGLSILASAGIRDLDLLVDSDPNKLGLFTPVSHLRVEAPSALVGASIDAVVISAMAYRREVERTLREELGFCGVVATLGHRLQLALPGEGAK